MTLKEKMKEQMTGWKDSDSVEDPSSFRKSFSFYTGTKTQIFPQ